MCTRRGGENAEVSFCEVSSPPLRPPPPRSPCLPPVVFCLARVEPTAAGAFPVSGQFRSRARDCSLRFSKLQGASRFPPPLLLLVRYCIATRTCSQLRTPTVSLFDTEKKRYVQICHPPTTENTPREITFFVVTQYSTLCLSLRTLPVSQSSQYLCLSGVLYRMCTRTCIFVKRARRSG